MSESELDAVHARTLFDHDRVCCVCQDRQKKFIHIHHIDGNHENNDPDNLAVLCQDCHSETQVQGGFFRKLSPVLVRQYRGEWLNVVRLARESKLPKVGVEDALMFSVSVDPISTFLQQFEDQHVLPLNATFHFLDYYFLTPGFPTLAIGSEQMTPENGEHFKSVLKAYLLCVLGLVAPEGMLVSDTREPKQASIGIRIGSDTLIRVPRWYVAGLEELSPLYLRGEYDVNSNQILLTLQPMIIAVQHNYDLLALRTGRISAELLGKDIAL